MSKVLAGRYEGESIISVNGKIFIAIGFKTIELSRGNVTNYEIVTEEHRKSASSGVARGLVGGALLGPVGALAGTLSAKNNNKYQIIVEFNDGVRSLIELDNKEYKIFLKQMFESGCNDNAHEIIDAKFSKSNKNSFSNFIKKSIIGVFFIVMLSALIQVLSGEKIFVDNNGSNIEYNILGEKTIDGSYGKCYRVGIEEPDDININDISKNLLDKYDAEDLEELKVYIYEQGHLIENMNEMFKGSKYELNITKEDNGYSYYFWDTINDSKIEDGMLNF